ncbi:TIGR02302 family protein [Roseovarius sp. MMSF_3281]|uniref:TIGR02302 family protein n=1 Tax=Roseovarius sp. MMSF_3281 TaxID=3046694 RepID=UPI00273EA5EE|nr:TIGR02302 family protein [Roseovarius sp. MMSF_3281]
MARPDTPLSSVMMRLRWPLTLTWAGLIAERGCRAFWPLWCLVASVAAVLMLGLHETLSVDMFWYGALAIAVAGLFFALRGLRRFRWPRREEAVARMDAAMPGHPLAALADTQAIGGGDAGSEALWRAHRARMAERAAEAKAVEPDLRLSSRDVFGLRYIALLGLMVALVFGSVWRVGSVGDMAPGGAALASGPAWEGWIEPPQYTGLPSLYLNDQKDEITVPAGSRVTLRLYGELGALSVSETVSERTEDLGAASDAEQSFDIVSDGELRIDGPGGQAWEVSALRDLPPQVEVAPAPSDVTFDGQMSHPFRARDDYGVVGGVARFDLDVQAVERRYGLAAEPEPRAPIELDLPMPITGDRAEFSETLIENLSKHPWAHMPVTLQLQVEDAAGQVGASEVQKLTLPARRFFDPMAAAVIEQRRDLLWSRDNGKRVAQVLRAISHRPEDGMFRRETAYLRLRVILRRLETLAAYGGFDAEARDEIAEAMWDLALILEEGDIGDALERMRAAQERLSEAMRNGASEEEIERLMDELRQATNDYMRQKMQQAQRENRERQQNGEQPDASEDSLQMTQQDLQDMMDRIQELMEQGRMAEAQEALEQFQQMMENMRVTEGQGGQGQTPGQQAMEGLAETLRDQQGLSDQAFRDLQEQFNPNAQSGQSPGNEGRDGGQGQGQSHDQPGEGQGQGQQPGQRGQGQDQAQQGQGGQGSLADRQEALRRQLEQQRGNMPGGGGEAGEAARESLDRAERAMDGAEEALRGDDLGEAIDRQAEAMEALREGMRNLGEQLAQEGQQQQGGQGQARGQPGQQQNDPLGRAPGQGQQAGTQDNLLQGEDVYRRARELLDEIRRRSGDGERPEVELEYLERLLDRF